MIDFDKYALTDEEREVKRLSELGLTIGDIATRTGFDRPKIRELRVEYKFKESMQSARFEARELLEPPKSEVKNADELRVVLANCNVPPQLMGPLMRRLREYYGGRQIVKEPKNDAERAKMLEERHTITLAFMDEMSMAQASFKDLAAGSAQLLQQAQLLRGQPTSIISMDDRRSLKELRRALVEEMKRRERRMIDVTPKAEARAG